MIARIAILAAILSAPALPALAAQPGACVTNGTEESYFFAAEATGGSRETATLAPGATLCSAAAAAQGGVVSVFESAEHLEGCSRLVPEAITETLLQYADFDRCRWTSHEN